MQDLTVTIREIDRPTLEALAEREWRTPEQQASAIIEAALATVRARANAPERPRGTSRRTAAARANGVPARGEFSEAKGGALS